VTLQQALKILFEFQISSKPKGTSKGKKSWSH